MADNEYLLADKAYELDRHLITPYKMPIARQPSHRAFNYAHSVERVKIEHAFGVLKARWPSLKGLGLRIGDDIERDHLRVVNWIMACLVLHNFLSLRHEEDDWLAAAIDEAVREQAGPNNGRRNAGGEAETSQAMKLAGERLRTSLREAIAGLNEGEEA
jgi:hypothetical protein